MAEDKDYLGEKLRLAERAREDAYFRTRDDDKCIFYPCSVR
jgi:hypothetical protein